MSHTNTMKVKRSETNRQSAAALSNDNNDNESSPIDNDDDDDGIESDMDFQTEDMDDSDFLNDLRSHSDDWMPSTDTGDNNHDDVVNHNQEKMIVDSERVVVDVPTLIENNEKYDVPITSSATSNTNQRKAIVPTTKPNTSTRSGRKRTRVRYDGSSTPKRPLSAYNIFFQRERQIIIKEYQQQQQEKLEEQQEQSTEDNNILDTSNNNNKKRTRSGSTSSSSTKTSTISFQQLGKMIGQRWQSLSKIEKRELQKLATLDGLRYRDEMDNYERLRRQKISDVCRREVMIPSPLSSQIQSQSIHLNDHHRSPHSTSSQKQASLSEFMARKRNDNETSYSTERKGGLLDLFVLTNKSSQDDSINTHNHNNDTNSEENVQSSMTSAVADAIIRHNKNEAATVLTTLSTTSSRNKPYANQFDQKSHTFLPYNNSIPYSNQNVDNNDLSLNPSHHRYHHHQSDENDNVRLHTTSSFPSTSSRMAIALPPSSPDSAVPPTHRFPSVSERRTHHSPTVVYPPNHTYHHHSYPNINNPDTIHHGIESSYYNRKESLTPSPSFINKESLFHSPIRSSHMLRDRDHHHHNPPRYDTSLPSSPHPHVAPSATASGTTPKKNHQYDSDFAPPQRRTSISSTNTVTTQQAAVALTKFDTKSSHPSSIGNRANRIVSHNDDNGDKIQESQYHNLEIRCAPMSFLEDTQNALPTRAIALDESCIPHPSRQRQRQNSVTNPTEIASSTSHQRRRSHSYDDINPMMKVNVPDSITGIQRTYQVEYKYYKLSESDANLYIQRLHECHQPTLVSSAMSSSSKSTESSRNHHLHNHNNFNPITDNERR